jgi:FKBP-type peptidyl-prolyl cis-trans isomerase
MNKLRVTVVTILTVSLALFFSSCSDDDKDTFDAAAQFEKEVDAIDAYLESNSIPHIKDFSGIRIVPTFLGTKLPAQTSSTINVAYKGSLFSTGGVFEEGTADGLLSTFIPGWQIALRKLAVGSKATLYIPSYYAYGNAKSTKIPENSTLVFDVTVNSVTPSTVFKQRFTSDTTAISNYITKNGFQVQKDQSGIKYQHLVEGTGETPSWFSTVKVKLTYTLLSDDSKSVGTYERGPTADFSSFVVDYIQGIQVSLMKMKEGGKLRAFVPSGLGFGIENALDGSNVIIIPANSNIIVDIELLEVN